MIPGPRYSLAWSLSLTGTVKETMRSVHCEGALNQESRALHLILALLKAMWLPSYTRPFATHLSFTGIN